MTTKKRKNSIIFAIVAGVIVASAISIFLRSKPPKNLTVSIGTFSTAIDYAPYYIARHHGWFNQELSQAFGREVAVDASLEFTSVGDIVSAFQNQQLHVLFSAEAPAIVMQSGDKVKFEFSAIGCTLQQEIIVQPDVGISSIKDLQGKKVAVLTGTSSHYGLLNVLAQNNVASDSVEIVDMGPGTAEDAFTSKEVDAWAVWPPFPERHQLDKSGVVLRGGDAVIHSVASRLKTDDANISKAQSAIAAAIARAKQWMINNPEEAQSIVAKETGESVEVVRLAWPKHDWAAELSEEVIVDMQRKAKFLSEVQPKVANRLVDVQEEMID